MYALYVWTLCMCLYVYCLCEIHKYIALMDRKGAEKKQLEWELVSSGWHHSVRAIVCVCIEIRCVYEWVSLLDETAALCVDGIVTCIEIWSGVQVGYAHIHTVHISTWWLYVCASMWLSVCMHWIISIFFFIRFSFLVHTVPITKIHTRNDRSISTKCTDYYVRALRSQREEDETYRPFSYLVCVYLLLHQQQHKLYAIKFDCFLLNNFLLKICVLIFYSGFFFGWTHLSWIVYARRSYNHNKTHFYGNRIGE